MQEQKLPAMVLLYLTQELLKLQRYRIWLARLLLYPVPVTLLSMRSRKHSSWVQRLLLSRDSTGWIYDPEGIDVAALKEIKEVKRARLTEYKNYRPNAEYHEGQRRMERKM